MAYYRIDLIHPAPKASRAAPGEALRDVPASDAICFVGPYRDRNGRIHIDFVAPLGRGERRSGAAIVFLSELRHRSSTTTLLRVSATDPQLLSAQIFRHKVRIGDVIESVDYR